MLNVEPIKGTSLYRIYREDNLTVGVYDPLNQLVAKSSSKEHFKNQYKSDDLRKCVRQYENQLRNNNE